MTRDRATGSLSLLLGIFVAIGAYQLPKSKMPGDIGPAAFPYITAGLLIICGLGLLITGREKSPAAYTKAQFIRLVTVIGVVLAYIVGLHLIGFIIPTLAEAFALCTMFAKGKTELALWKRLLFAALVTGILYVSFEVLLKMPLPAGILF